MLLHVQSISRASLRRRLAAAGVPERELSRVLSRPSAPAYGLGGLLGQQQQQEQPGLGQAQPGQVELGTLNTGMPQQLQYNAQVVVEEGNGYGDSTAALHAATVDSQAGPQHADSMANGSAKTMAEQVRS